MISPIEDRARTLNQAIAALILVLLAHLVFAGFLVFNSVTAFSANDALKLTSRFFAGVAAGLAWKIP